MLLFAQFFTPLMNIGDEWQTVQAALAGAERVFAVLALPAGTPTPTARLSGEPKPDPVVVRVDKVSFGYDPHRRVLHEISLTVHPGEHVAVVGRTGAGKSSLLALLAGLYSPWAGRIELAGHPPQALDDSQRRTALGFVPQHVTLFSGSVQDNLTLGDPGIAAEQARRAAAIAGADRFITALPDGYRTLLSDAGRGSGVQLSAGQRQLLALARALTTSPAELLAADTVFAALSALEDAGWDWQHDPATA